MKQAEIKQWVAEQNWSLRDADIARMTGIKHMVVRQRRIKAGIPKGKISLLQRPSIWSNVDWSQPDSAIAAQRDVSRQCVAHYRAKFAPKLPAD